MNENNAGNNSNTNNIPPNTQILPTPQPNIPNKPVTKASLPNNPQTNIIPTPLNNNKSTNTQVTSVNQSINTVNQNIASVKYSNVNQNSLEVNNREHQKEEVDSNTDKNKKTLKKVFTVLIVIGLLIVLVASLLLVDDNNKYKTYTITVADLVDFDKVEKTGLVFYRAHYKYKVKRKEYFYTPKELYEIKPNEIIQLKYNPQDPNKVYEKGASKYFFILLFIGIGLSFISVIAIIAFTKTKDKKIITVQVIEQVNCVGGKRIYLDNININSNNEEEILEKYYVYFTKDKNKFALGNKLTFNIFKYGEVFIPEKYKNITARTIYDFKDEDFTLLPQETNSKI